MPPAAKLQTLMTRFAASPPLPKPNQSTTKATGKRIQKNLTIAEEDAMRLKELAARENISQARLLALALDAYEHCHGALDQPDLKS